jgi:transaldolase
MTTNLSRVAKEGRIFRDALMEICNIVDGPRSAPRRSTSQRRSRREEFAKISQHIIGNVPLISEGLQATNRMATEGINVNVTRCFPPTYALLAANASASLDTEWSSFVRL